MILVENLLGIKPVAGRAEAVEGFVLCLGDQFDARAKLGAIHVA